MYTVFTPSVQIPIAAFNQRKAIAERIQKQCSFQPILRMFIILSFLREHFSGNIYKSDKEI